MAKINDDGFLELSGVHNNDFQKQQLSSANFSVLEGLSPLNMRILNQASQVMDIAKGVALMTAGDTAHDLYFIAQGSIAITKQCADKSLVVATLKAGDFYGEYGVLRGKTRFASVYTAEPSVMIRVNAQAIRQVLEADASFKDRLTSIMNQRILHSFLCTHVVFRDSPAPVRETLAAQLTVSTLERGETLFAQGDRATKYYLILSGEAEVLIQQSDKRLLLEIRRDNDALGEVRLQQGSQYGYTVVATDELDLLALNQTIIQLIQQADSAIVKRLQQFILQQQQKTMGKMKSL